MACAKKKGVRVKKLDFSIERKMSRNLSRFLFLTIRPPSLILSIKLSYFSSSSYTLTMYKTIAVMVPPKQSGNHRQIQ